MKSTTGALLALRLYNSSSVVIPTRQEGEVFDGNISKNAEPEIFMDKLCELFAQVSLDRRDEFDGIFAQLTACNDPLDGATEQALYPELIEA